jgi:hypothetical protein
VTEFVWFWLDAISGGEGVGYYVVIALLSCRRCTC